MPTLTLSAVSPYFLVRQFRGCLPFYFIFILFFSCFAERLDVRRAAVGWACGAGFGGMGVHPLLAAFISSFRGLRSAGFYIFIVSCCGERLVRADAHPRLLQRAFSLIKQEGIAENIIITEKILPQKYPWKTSPCLGCQGFFCLHLLQY